MATDGQALGEVPRGVGLGRRSIRSRRIAALAALGLGVVGLLASLTGVVIQLLPRTFSAGEQNAIMAWQVGGRWRQMSAGRIFPSDISYQLSASLLEDTAPLYPKALRVGIAPQAACASGVVTRAAATILRRFGCEAVLRATYVDATRSYVMTVGVAVLPRATAATAAQTSLSGPRLASAHDPDAVGRLPEGVLTVQFGGAAGQLYDYSRQISDSFNTGPYVVMYSAGYADGRPQVPVSQDRYSDSEMTSMAHGVAQSVANALGSPPPFPHCPGSPGC